MSDHAIGILIGALLGVLILALIGLHRKNKRDKKFFADMEKALREEHADNPSAWDSVPRRYKR